MGVFGDTLRQARAQKGITLREAEVATRIKRHWLLALEEEHFDELPALIYQRGIVRNYATFLNLDPAKLLMLFTEARGGHIEDSPAVMATPTMVATPGSFVPNFAVIAFVLVAMSAAFVWGYSAYFGGAQGNPNANGVVATATQLGDEERFIATSTLPPATNTPQAEATRKATAITLSGSATETPVASEPTITNGGVISLTGDDQVTPDDASTGNVDENSNDSTGESTSIDAANQGDEVAYSFYTDQDVNLIVVVDNTIAWNTTLYAGTSTGYLRGHSFVVSITGADSIIVIDGQNVAETYYQTEFTLP
jgi:cytoskeletal protein RodZ